MNFADIRLRISGFSFQVPKLCIHDSQEGHLKFFCLFAGLVMIILFFFITNQIFYRQAAELMGKT